MRTKLELLKSKSWFKTLLLDTNLDLYCGPMKYGNSPIEFPLLNGFIFDVAKYAYTPFGNSGVMQNLPLCSSKSPEFVKT